MAQFLSDELRGIGIENIGNLDHLALGHQQPDDVDRPFSHAVGQILHGNGFRNGHFADDLLARRIEAALLALFLFAPAAHRCQRALALVLLQIGNGQAATAAIFCPPWRRLGFRPFRAETLSKLLQQIIYSTPPPVHTLRADIGEELEHMTAVAMQKDPSLRYPSGAEFAAALTHIHQSLRKQNDRIDQQEQFDQLRRQLTDPGRPDAKIG